MENGLTSDKAFARSGRRLVFWVGCTALTLGVIWLFAARVPDGPQLLIGPQLRISETKIEVPVVLEPRVSKVAAIQFEVIWDSRYIDLALREDAGTRGAGKRATVFDPAPGGKRVVVSGFNQNVLPEGPVVVLLLNVKPGASAREYSLSIRNVSGAGPDGSFVKVQSRSGSVFVNPES